MQSAEWQSRQYHQAGWQHEQLHQQGPAALQPQARSHQLADLASPCLTGSEPRFERVYAHSWALQLANRPQDFQAITSLYQAAIYNSGKDTFPGHDTITGLMIDGTTIVAFLADLSHFQQDGVTDTQARSDRQSIEVHPLGCQILGKITGAHIEACRSHLIDTLDRQQTDLTMPIATVGVTDQAKTFL